MDPLSAVDMRDEQIAPLACTPDAAAMPSLAAIAKRMPPGRHERALGAALQVTQVQVDESKPPAEVGAIESQGR